MPELPEVEFVVRSLDKIVKNRRISNAELRRERLAPENSPEDFAARLKGATINFVHRRGKHVLFDLNNAQTLITHLRMTGRFMLLSPEREDPKHTHAVFYFEDETRLVFQDQRHFGLMKIVETRALAETKEIKCLAPEPFSDDFTPEYLKNALKRSKRSLKEFLLDQTKVCGLGNIYAAEAMFLARLNPTIPARRVSTRKANLLFEKIREVLAEAVAHCENLEVDPENIDGGFYGGGGADGWRVYDRENAPCPACGKAIVRIVQSGRSSYFCPKCQKI